MGRPKGSKNKSKTKPIHSIKKQKKDYLDLTKKIQTSNNIEKKLNYLSELDDWKNNTWRVITWLAIDIFFLFLIITTQLL